MVSVFLNEDTHNKNTEVMNMKLSESKSDRKKEQILTSAIEIMKRRGYNGATMEDIAAELLMTKGSLYYYFKNKSDLMFHAHNFILSKAIAQLEDILNREGTAKEILHDMVAIHIEYAIEEKDTVNHLIDPKQFFDQEQQILVLQLRRKYEGVFEKIITRGIQSGEFATKDLTVAKMMILGAMNWIQQWYKPDGRLSKEELASLYSEYIMKILT
jgi:AcrR family transcriptional regulator